MAHRRTTGFWARAGAWLASALVLFAAAAASAQSRYASIVVDADTMEVLHARYADDPRFPASITKVMTLYLMFEALEDGRLRPDELLPVSRRAANQPPSKLGLNAGSSIAVPDAIRALVVRSANDASVVIAERLGGTEEGFARLMTAKARELGMMDTRFINASGLPSGQQLTTARDLARLTLAMRRDFPGYWSYFQTPNMVWNGQFLRNHNNLLGRVAGVDGLKTGFTSASGFNLATTAERGGRRIAAVVMGGSSAAQRDAHMEQLVNAAFAEIGRRSAVAGRWPQAEQIALVRGRDAADAMLLAADPDPIEVTLRGVLEQGSAERRGLQIVIEGDPSQALAPELNAPANRRVVLASASSDAVPAEPSTPRETAAPRRAPAPTQTIAEQAPPERRAERAERRARQQPQPRPGDWAIQVGAFNKREQATQKLSSIAANLPDALLGSRREVLEVVRGTDRLYRARFSGIAAGAAQEACRVLSRRGHPCMPLGAGAR